MLKVTRYINGIEVDKKDLNKYAIESDIISRVIVAVNKRLKGNFRQDTLIKKEVEKRSVLCYDKTSV
jgi:hypothetical protein